MPNDQINQPLTNAIYCIHLSSWRYFASLTIPPVIFALFKAEPLHAGIILLASGYVYYLCWRLCLDEKLFTVLNNPGDMAGFNTAMSLVWGGKYDKNRTMQNRWLAAKGLFLTSLFSIIVLWGIFITLVVCKLFH